MMSKNKRLLFLTGTRADFGKIKSLIEITDNSDYFDISIFVTGMHMHNKYGYTVNEITSCGFSNVFKFINFTSEESMDLTLAKTIDGLSSYVKEFNPDLIIVHGDRVEALAGAIVGALNNILVAHIEGGEKSGTIDDLIRHSVSKLSHIHLVCNEDSRRRLLQMGESDEVVYVIGSPDLDIMFSENLPSFDEVLDYYEIPFLDYGILMFHPVTTELELMKQASYNLVKALIKSNENYIVIYPNNDLGSSLILDSYKELNNNERFKIFPSLRFEYFLTLLKNSKFILGNSSCGIMEAPYYAINTVNIGTRQNNRNNDLNLINTSYSYESVLEGIELASNTKKYSQPKIIDIKKNSNEKFFEIIKDESFWNISKQKKFIDLNIT